MEKKIIKKYMELPGVSGHEQSIVKVLENRMKDLKFEIERDNLGSIFAIKKVNKSPEKAQTLLIDAHMDEVGFEVTGITKNGLLKFEEHGGIHREVLTGTKLLVWGKTKLSGIVLLEKPNPLTGKLQQPEIDKLLIDIGASSKDEVLNMGVDLGTQITFQDDVAFQGNRVIGKAADNRVGVAMIDELLTYIAKNKFDYNIIIGASVQEEVGLRGARTSTNKFKQDLTFVIDVSPSNDMHGEIKSEGSLGAGTMIRYKDALMVYPKVAINYIKKISKKNEIKTQDYFSQGGTNAGIIHLSNEGGVVIPLGIVARNLHTSASVFDISDYDETLKLAKCMLENLTTKKIKGFKQF